MFSNSPLIVSQSLLAAMGVRMFVHHQNRIPTDSAVVVVSNHRSFMDAPILMAALNRSIKIACHHYMSQVPLMREMVQLMGCFALDKPEQRREGFLDRATELLQKKEWVGLFPEGTKPMIELTRPKEMVEFQRGFAHLALKASVPNLAVLPVAIESIEERVNSTVPLKMLSLFDPSEPLFDRSGLHPMVIYQRTNVLVGRPYWIGTKQKQSYQGKGAKKAVRELTEYCQSEIAGLLGARV